MYLSNFSVIWLWCDEEIIDPESEPAIYIIAKLVRGSEIATNASITLYFNNAPADFMVSHGTARTSGNQVNLSAAVLRKNPLSTSA